MSVIAASCVILAVLWELGVLLARNPAPAQHVDPARFASFEFDWNGQKARRALLRFDDSQANLLVLSVALARPDGTRMPGPATLRLVHGYNMRDCMRIKGYAVSLITNTAMPQWVEAWELRSPSGERTLWVTAILRAADFSLVPMSVTDLAFPRVGIPDEQDWEFKGLTVDSIKHPVANFGKVLRTKWNGARCDLATVLKLRQPAQPSSQLLTVAAFAGLDQQADSAAVQVSLTRLLGEFATALQTYGRAESAGTPRRE